MQLDLFGVGVGPTLKRRGRPPFKKTDENQRLAVKLMALGYSQSEICEAINASPKALRHYFSREPAFVSRWGRKPMNEKESQ